MSFQLTNQHPPSHARFHTNPPIQVAAYSMFVATMAFHARISDPAIGGTYMTLLNTVSNLAGMWPGTLSLWLVDNVSFKDCEGVTDFSLDCDTMQELQVGLVYCIQWNPIFIRDINECVDFFQGL